MAARQRMRRKDIRKPDPFMAAMQRATGAMAPHARRIGIGVLVAIVVAAVAWGLHYQEAQESERIGVRLNEAAERYVANLEAAVAGEEPDWAGLEEDLEELYAAAKGTDQYPKVLFFMMHTFLEQDRAGAALGVGQELDAATVDDPKLRAAALYVIGKAHEVDGDYQQARELWQQARQLSRDPLGDLLSEEVQRLKGGPVAPQVKAAFLGETGGQPADSSAAEPGKLKIPMGQ